MKKKINQVYRHKNIDGLIPGVSGQRAFPSQAFRSSDPFLMLDHIGPQKMPNNWFLDGSGHDHPHRGFETITFMFEGRLDHRDSLGNKSQLSSGSVQRMNAGSGIIHGGDMASDTESNRFHEMQLWINNPISDKMSTPDIHNLSDNEIPSKIYGEVECRVISGTLNGLTSPIRTKASTQIGHIISKESGSVTIEGLDARNNVMVYILEGSAVLDDMKLLEHQLAHMNEGGSTIDLEVMANSQVLVLSGRSLNEPVVFGGPFVMSTQEEIKQANLDYQQGKFGKI